MAALSEAFGLLVVAAGLAFGLFSGLYLAAAAAFAVTMAVEKFCGMMVGVIRRQAKRRKGAGG